MIYPIITFFLKNIGMEKFFLLFCFVKLIFDPFQKINFKFLRLYKN